MFNLVHMQRLSQMRQRTGNLANTGEVVKLKQKDRKRGRQRDSMTDPALLI